MLLNVGKQELQMIKTRCIIVVDCVRIFVVYIHEVAPFRPIYNHPMQLLH